LFHHAAKATYALSKHREMNLIEIGFPQMETDTKSRLRDEKTKSTWVSTHKQSRHAHIDTAAAQTGRP